MKKSLKGRVSISILPRLTLVLILGLGDYQFDVYRMMKEYNGNSWDDYRPFTNAMVRTVRALSCTSLTPKHQWLHYLTQKLLYSKRLKPPSTRKKITAEPTTLTGFDEQECYDSLVEMDRLLGSCITTAQKGRKGQRKICVPPGLKSAGDVVLYGAQKGWVKAL